MALVVEDAGCFFKAFKKPQVQLRVGGRAFLPSMKIFAVAFLGVDHDFDGISDFKKLQPPLLYPIRASIPSNPCHFSTLSSAESMLDTVLRELQQDISDISFSSIETLEATSDKKPLLSNDIKSKSNG